MEFPDDSSFPCPSLYRGCGGWPFGNRIHRLMRSFHPSIINIAEGSISRPLEKKILKIYFSVPQCFPRNDRILMVLSAYQRKIFKEGCEKGVLMQYKCMEKEIRKLHGRILFPSVMYIAIIPAEMQL